MSTLAKRAPSAVVLRPEGTGKTIERRVQVVTLVHGGGPVSSEGDDRQSPTRRHDDVTPLRGSAVRGQLRFWWRATHGCTSHDPAELREREDILWGNASQPGLVDLAIEQTFSTEQVLTNKLGQVGTGLRYGAFASANLTRMRGTARIRLNVTRRPGSEPDASDRALQSDARQVEDALTAWLLFGGIGGRTRRGFGALGAEDLPEPRVFVSGLHSAARLAKVPALRGEHNIVFSSKPFSTPEEAHTFAVDALRKFRQGVGVGRNPGQQRNRPGRSRWPEADRIRRLQGKHAPLHAPTHPVDAFPRGAFGMPIVFHFVGQGEPADSHLVPSAKIGRMTSPLILRPVRVGGRWHAMAARLTIPDLDLTQGLLSYTHTTKAVRIDLAHSEVGKIAPLAAQGNGPDVVAAFMVFFAALSI